MTPMLETWFYERLLWEMTIINVKGKKKYSTNDTM